MNQFNRQYLIKSNGETIVDGTKPDPPQIIFSTESVFGARNLDGYGVSCAEISVYNLNPGNRKLLTSKEARDKYGFRDIELWAGYEGNLSRIFGGVIRNAFVNTPDGVNQVVTMYCRSSGGEYENTAISKTFGKMTPAEEVIRYVAGSFGFPVSIHGDFSLEPNYSRGLSLSKDTKSILNDLAETHKFVWQIENKKVVIIKEGAVRTASVKNYTPESLLIGGTEITEIGANIAVMLDPSLVPYGKVNIKSSSPVASFSGVYLRDVNIKQGEFTIYQVAHNGVFCDADGGVWETRTVCKR